MRIAMVTTFYPPYSFGGDATYVRALSRGLVARGHEVEVIHCADAFEMLHDGPPSEPEPDDPGVTVHRLRSGVGLLSPLITQQTGLPGLKGRALRKFLEQGRFDVVNFHNVSLVGGPGVLAYSNAPVTLYTMHEHWLICPTHILWKNRERACDRRTCFSCSIRSGIPPQLWRYTPLLARALEHVDSLLSPSQFTADQHRAVGITRPIEVLPLFSAFQPAAAPPATAPSGFLFAGRVVRPKGLEPVLKLFAGLPEHRLTIIGEGEARAALQSAYAACPNIRFLGRLPQAQLASHYAAASALIFPSLTPESFGLSIVEAAACGTPSLVRAGAGGSPEIVEKSGGGLVYRNDAELIAAVRKLAGDPDYRQTLGRRARADYEQRYTLDIHLDGYERLVQTIRAAKGLQAGLE
jgi:glycosyltransferase involved in cell wall biosynthesis